MHPAFAEIDHRPWPLPSKGWRLSQKWKDLCFIHYRIPRAHLRPRVPEALEIEEFDGSAWVGVVAFRMEDVRPRFLPAISRISTFPELNVRTYVRHGDRSGVWFFSLDCPSRITVHLGRTLLGLPYNLARTTMTRGGNEIGFCSSRPGLPGDFRSTYRPAGAPAFAEPGSFEEWMAERYCLYAASDRHALVRLDVHHPRWRLQSCELELPSNNLFANVRLAVADGSPHVCFSPGVDIVSYSGDRL